MNESGDEKPPGLRDDVTNDSHGGVHELTEVESNRPPDAWALRQKLRIQGTEFDHANVLPNSNPSKKIGHSPPAALITTTSCWLVT